MYYESEKNLKDYDPDAEFVGYERCNEMETDIGLQVDDKLTFEKVQVGQFFRYNLSGEILFKIDVDEAVVVASLDRSLLGSVVTYHPYDRVDEILKNAKLVWGE